MDETGEETEALPLSKAVDFLLEECRMVLPGIQALFGFQLVAVFSQGFGDKLSRPEQILHLVATALSVIAVAFVMTPAALHRATPRDVTLRFVLVSTRLLLASMLPLALSISLDFYLVGRVIAGGSAAIAAAVVLALFVLFWFVVPRARALQAVILRVGGSRLPRAER